MRLGLLALLCAPAMAYGQAVAVAGVVRDASALAPLPRAELTVRDSRDRVVGRTTSSDAGAFRVEVPSAGTYFIDARRLGYVPTLRRRIVVGPTGLSGLAIALAPVAQQLDTITTLDRRRGRITPAREVVQQHLALNRGLIVHGAEIRGSGMLLSEYLGKLDGMALMTTQPPGLPVIPAANGKYLTYGRDSRCIYARINHASLFGILVQRNAETIDDLMMPNEIMAVEIYRTTREIPAEWRGLMMVEELFVRQNMGIDYTIGNTGKVMDVATTQEDSLLYWTRRIYPAEDRVQPTLVQPLPVRERGRRILVDPSAPARMVPRVSHPPTCAYMQIWTRRAWG